MKVSNLFLILAILCGLWGVVSIIAIASYLSKHNIKINIVFFRVLALKYLSQYHEINRKESGKTGPWFYSYVVSMNLAFLLAIFGIILK